MPREQSAIRKNIEDRVPYGMSICEKKNKKNCICHYTRSVVIDRNADTTPNASDDPSPNDQTTSANLNAWQS
jgi:hypothetical protein